MLVQERNRAMYVDGLQAMQAYLALRNEQIEIPVGRVVSIADMTLHYIFSVPCADRAEYDALVYRNVGRDRQLTVITLIVLAAMLRRTEGPQARACRAVLMEDRNEDFYDGVSLYERFLKEGPDSLPFREGPGVGFPQEDFETDIMNEILSLRHETMELKNKISHMENQPQTIINVAGNYIAEQNIDIHDNPYANIYANGESQEPRGASEHSDKSEDVPFRVPIPRENKYTEVRQYIEERKRHDEEFKHFCQTHSLRDLCDRLTDEFGWLVDENSLQKNLNRNR